MTQKFIKVSQGEWQKTSVSHRGRKIYIGIEWEFDARPSAVTMPSSDLASSIVRLFNDTNSMEYAIQSDFHHDVSLACGQEIRFHPTTIEAFNLLEPKFYKAFRMMQDANYLDQLDRAGGHLHLSRHALGKTLATQQENINRLIKWFYVNKIDLMKFAMRQENMMFRFYNEQMPHKMVAINTLHKNTIEFRLFDGLKTVDQLYANLELVDLLARVLIHTTKNLESMNLDTVITNARKHHKRCYNHWLSVK